MEQLVNHSGSVDDIRCALTYINPKTAGKSTVDMLEASLKNEKEEHYKRATVIKMIETKLRQIKKYESRNIHNC